MEITTGKQTRPQRVVVYGPEGIGKTTFAAAFPRPVFIDTEGSTEHLDVSRTPRPSSWAHLLEMVSSLRQNPRGFQTLVVDTADWAERLCVDAVCAKHQQNGIEGFGYGKGYTYLAEEFGRLLDAVNGLRDTGMHIVFTAHAATRKWELPEETGSYDRWEMKLTKKLGPLTKEWADLVLFANYETYVVVDEKTKSRKAQGGHRVMFTSHHPCWDAKNRHGLDDRLDFDFKHVAHCFPVGNVAAPKADPPVQQPAPSPAPVAQPYGVSAELRQLRDLMQQSGISDADLQQAMAARGWFPPNMPLENLPLDFVRDKLVAQWAKVVNVIAKGKTNVAA